MRRMKPILLTIQKVGKNKIPFQKFANLLKDKMVANNSAIPNWKKVAMK